MKIFRLFYDSIFHYSKTLYAYRMRFWPRMGYLLLLSLVMLLPMMRPVSQVMNTWETNRSAILDSIPQFETSGRAIQTNTEPFVNQTDFMTYIFDPEDTIDTTNIDKPATAILTFETGKDAFSVTLMDQEVMNFPYDGREAGSSVQKDFIGQATGISRAVVYITAYISSFLSMLFNGLILALIFSFMRMSQKLNLNFGQKFNYVLSAMTLSTVVSSLVALVLPSFIVGQAMIIFFVGWIQLFYLSSHTRIISIDRDQWNKQHEDDNDE